jgi:cytochrome P450
LVEARAAAAPARGGGCSGGACALDQLRHADPAMPDGICVDNLIFILNNASENVVSLLRWLIKIVGEHPPWSERLRREVDAGGGVGAPGPRLADRIAMETLRLAQSEYLYRVVREELEVGSFVIPAGWLLRVCVHESHRDEAIWPEPAKFDPDRFLGRTAPRTHYSPFGFHQHACNGVDLNNMICRATLEELAAGFDWSIVRDGPVERDFRHWSHWRPSAKLLIAISPRCLTVQRRRRSERSETGTIRGSGITTPSSIVTSTPNGAL